VDQEDGVLIITVVVMVKMLESDAEVSGSIHHSVNASLIRLSLINIL